MRSNMERAAGAYGPQCVDEDCICDAPSTASASSDPKTSQVLSAKGIPLVNGTDRPAANVSRVRSLFGDAEPMDTNDDGALTAGAASDCGAAANAVPAGAVSAGVVSAGAVSAGAVPAGVVSAGAVSAGAVSAGAVSVRDAASVVGISVPGHASGLYDYAPRKAVATSTRVPQLPGRTRPPPTIISVVTGQPVVNVKPKDVPADPSVNHRQLIYYCSPKRLVPTLITQHHARQAVTVVMSISRYMKRFFNQSEPQPLPLLSERVKAEPDLLDKFWAFQSEGAPQNNSPWAAAAPKYLTASLTATTVAVTVTCAPPAAATSTPAAASVPVAVPSTTLAAAVASVPAPSSGRPQRKTRLHCRYGLEDWELAGLSALSSSDDEDYFGGKNVSRVADPVAVRPATAASSGAPKRLYSLLNGNVAASSVAVQRGSCGGTTGITSTAPSGSAVHATSKQAPAVSVSVASCSSASKHVRPEESLRPIVPLHTKAPQQLSGMTPTVRISKSAPENGIARPATAAAAAAEMPRPAKEAGTADPGAHAWPPKPSPVAISPKPMSVATPKSAEMVSTHKPIPSIPAITPKSASVALTPKSASVALIPKSASVAVTPKSASVAVTPMSTASLKPSSASATVTPKPTSAAVTSKPPMTAVAPQSAPVAPKSASKRPPTHADELSTAAGLAGAPQVAAPVPAPSPHAPGIASAKRNKVVDVPRATSQAEAPVRRPVVEESYLPPDGTDRDVSGYKCLLVVHEKNAPAQVMGKLKHVLTKKNNSLRLNPIVPPLSSSTVAPVATDPKALGRRMPAAGASKQPGPTFSGPTFLMGRIGAHLANLFPVTAQIKQALERGKLNIAPDSAVTLGVDSKMHVIMPSSSSASSGTTAGSSTKNVSRDMETGRSTANSAAPEKLAASSELGGSCASSCQNNRDQYGSPEKCKSGDDFWLPPAKKARLMPDAGTELSPNSSQSSNGCEGDQGDSVPAGSSDRSAESDGNAWWFCYLRPRGKKLRAGGWRSSTQEQLSTGQASKLYTRDLQLSMALDEACQFGANTKKMEAMFEALKLVRKTHFQPSVA